MCDLKRAIEVSIYDVIFLSETGLSDEFSESEVKVTDYDIYRCDRDLVLTGMSKGGGVMIAIRSRFKSRKIGVASRLNSIDHVFVLLQIGSTSYLLGCVYIPPSSSLDAYLEHYNVVEELSCRFPDSKIIIVGDYNLPDAQWSIDDESSMIVDCSVSSPAVQVCESFNSLSLYQANSLPNNHGVFLDLLFTNEIISTTTCSDPLLSNNFHHNAFCFNIPISGEREMLPKNSVVYDFAKCDLVGLNDFLSKVDWSFISSSNDLEFSTDRFYEFVLEGIRIFTPVKRVFDSSYPVWFSNELKSLVSIKKKAHLDYKRSGLESDYIRFSSLRSRCDYLNTKCYKKYLEKSDESLKTNPRFFWKFANSSRKVDGFPRNMFLKTETSCSAQETVNLFAKSFSSVYQCSNSPIPDYPQLDCVDFGTCSLSSSEVKKALVSLPPKFSSGPDRVPSFILKKCAISLANPLACLFNKSLSSGHFPCLWKSSYVLPIFKSGDRSDIANYRGVCIQSAVPKVLDSLVSQRLSFSCRHLISDRQHGFTVKRSTVTNLLSYQHDILSSFQSGCDVHSIYTDVAKAFDRVDSRFLTAKLKSYGIGDSYLRWLESSLSGRTQLVKIGDSVSSSIEVLSGVGQGSHSGPLLFSLFFNDLHTVIHHSLFQMFADDVKLYRSISNSDDCALLQHDLDSFSQWLSLNGLQLTLSKCATICFSRRRSPVHFEYYITSQPLVSVNEIRDLGVIFDRQLSFSSHVSSLSMRCHRLLGFIFRTTKGLSPSSFRILYLSLVRSLLEYACVVWSPFYNVHEHTLDRVQKRFLSYYQFRYPGNPPNVEDLRERRVQADSKFFEKLLSGEVDCSQLLGLVFLDCHRRLRRGKTFYLTACGTNYMYNAPLNRMMRVANSKI